MSAQRHPTSHVPSQPLQVLPELAVAIGLNEAIVLQQVHYWLSPDKDQGQVVDGRRWIYNAYEQWQANFPFWSVRTIRRTFTSLEQKGLLESRDDLNQHAIDRTKWHTVNYESPLLQGDSQVATPCGQIGPLDGPDWPSLHITETTTESRRFKGDDRPDSDDGRPDSDNDDAQMGRSSITETTAESTTGDRRDTNR